MKSQNNVRNACHTHRCVTGQLTAPLPTICKLDYYRLCHDIADICERSVFHHSRLKRITSSLPVFLLQRNTNTLACRMERRARSPFAPAGAESRLGRTSNSLWDRLLRNSSSSSSPMIRDPMTTRGATHLEWLSGGAEEITHGFDLSHWWPNRQKHVESVNLGLEGWKIPPHTHTFTHFLFLFLCPLGSAETLSSH